MPVSWHFQGLSREATQLCSSCFSRNGPLAPGPLLCLSSPPHLPAGLPLSFLPGALPGCCREVRWGVGSALSILLAAALGAWNLKSASHPLVLRAPVWRRSGDLEMHDVPTHRGDSSPGTAMHAVISPPVCHGAGQLSPLSMKPFLKRRGPLLHSAMNHTSSFILQRLTSHCGRQAALEASKLCMRRAFLLGGSWWHPAASGPPGVAGCTAFWVPLFNSLASSWNSQESFVIIAFKLF